MQPPEKNRGYAASVGFGLVGVIVGGAIGLLTARLVAPDDLGGIGVTLIWLILLASLGAGGGVAVGLITRGHAKAGLTAVLAAPATFMVAFGGLVAIARIGGSFGEEWVTALLGWGLQAVLVALALAAVRWVSLKVEDRT